MEDRNKSQHGILPRLFDHTLRSKRFLRSVKDETLNAVLHRAEWGREGWASGEVMLRALQILETEVRTRVAKRPDELEHADMLLIEDAKGARVSSALVRTGFEDVGIAWERYTPESKERVSPYEGKWPWEILALEDPKPEVLRQLGPIAASSDGVITTSMHIEMEDKRGIRYAKRETKACLRFVRPWDHPDWKALLASVAEHSREEFGWTDW